MDETRRAVRVYSYGTVPTRNAAVLGEDLAETQLKLAGRLWNLLVTIDRARVARYRRIMYDATQERIDAIRDEIVALRESVRAARKLVRSRQAELGEMPERLKTLRAAFGSLIQQQRDTAAQRHDVRKVELQQLKMITARRIVKARQAAASCGLFWGSYNEILARADVARRAGDMHFRRTMKGADGTLTTQIIGGTDVAKCVAGQHTSFRIDAATIGQKWRYARMRIGSNENRSPQWLGIPIIYHRDIPDEARIKSVSMTRRHGRWQLNVTVLLAAPEVRTTGPAIAIDLGWRLMDDGSVRVAYWADTEGKEGDVRVNARDLEALAKVHGLRAIADKRRDDILRTLVPWLSQQDLPEEWQRETVAIAQWRSGNRLARLVRWWADHRLPDDEKTFLAARDWRKKHIHLTNWWRNQQQQMCGRIREQYRTFATQRISLYGTVYVEEFDLRKVSERPPAESDKVITGSSRYRHVVSPSVFRAAVLNVAQRDGVRVIKVLASY